MSPMEGDVDARGPLWIVLPDLWMHTNLTAGFLSKPGRSFSAWVILSTMSATPAVRKLP